MQTVFQWLAEFRTDLHEDFAEVVLALDVAASLARADSPEVVVPVVALDKLRVLRLCQTLPEIRIPLEFVADDLPHDVDFDGVPLRTQGDAAACPFGLAGRRAILDAVSLFDVRGLGRLKCVLARTEDHALEMDFARVEVAQEFVAALEAFDGFHSSLLCLGVLGTRTVPFTPL